MNPYKVLGVNETASQEEIRAAYLSLVKKYHPDRYTETSLKEMANEKLKEINLAYETLTKKPAGNGYAQGRRSQRSGQPGYGYGYGNGSGAYGGYSERASNTDNWGGSYSGPYAAQLRRVRELYLNNRLDEASGILDTVPEHGAEWYYLYGMIYVKQNWYEKARMFLRKAYEMEPDVQEYRIAYMTFCGRERQYTRQASTSGFPDELLCNPCCTPLCLCC